MSKSLYRLPIFAIAAIASASALSWASAPSEWDRNAQSQKADYMFLEAQAAYNANEIDKYVMLIERAYALDSADLDIASEWGLIAFSDESTDSATLEKAYRLIRRNFMANPGNYVSGVQLSNAASQMGKADDAVQVWEMLDSVYPTRSEVAYELANAYLRKFVANSDTASAQKALAIYDRIEQANGRGVDIASKKLYTYYLMADTASVVSEIDSLYQSAPDDSYTALFVGANYQYIDKPDLAIKYLDLACQLDSTNGTAYLQRARFYNAQGDSAAFDQEVFQALRSPYLDVESKVDILHSYVAELYTDPAQEPRIRQLFDNLQLMHPGEAEIHSLYGAYLSEIDDSKGACEQFSYVVALDPGDKSAWVSYITEASLSGDTATVYQATREAMKKFPTETIFPISLATTYHADGQTLKGIAVLDSIDITPISNRRVASNILGLKGDMYAAVGDTVKALETYDEAIDLNPDNHMALNNAAYFITLSGGDLDKAERYSAESLNGDELNTTYLDTYAWVFYHKKDYKMAKYYIDIALDQYLVPEATAEGAEADATGESDGEVPVTAADDEGDTAAEAPSADIYDHAGDIYFMNGEKAQALKYWEKALALDPDNEIIQKKVRHKTIFDR